MKSFKETSKRRKVLGKCVKERREELGKSARETEAEAGLPKNKLSQIEEGLTSTDASTELIDIAEVLELPPTELLQEAVKKTGLAK